MNFAFILAAGQSQRFSKNQDKLWLKIHGKPLLYYTLSVFQNHPQIDQIFLAVNSTKLTLTRRLVKKYHFTKVTQLPVPPLKQSLPSRKANLDSAPIIPGGKTRQSTFFKLFRHVKPALDDLVLVHNAANPLVTPEEISAVIKATQKSGAAFVAHPVTDTIHHCHPCTSVMLSMSKHEILKKCHPCESPCHPCESRDLSSPVSKNTAAAPRHSLLAAQTPQAARAELFQKAIQSAIKTRHRLRTAKRNKAYRPPTFTDEVSLLKSINVNPTPLPASPNNFKITFPRDFELAKILLGDTPTNFRVGVGQDSHRFSKPISSVSRQHCHSCESRNLSTQNPSKPNSLSLPKTPAQLSSQLILAGLKFPKYPKLEANSDGDVILHALYNALSSALSGRSISRTADPLFKEHKITDSRKYLKPLLQKIAAQKLTINNISLSLEGSRPRLEPHVPKMKKSLSHLLEIPESKIGLTLTSGENLTPFGQGDGLACIAYISLIS